MAAMTSFHKKSPSYECTRSISPAAATAVPDP